MIKNFEEIKDQLKELSDVINSFKSEAVQLRIVELVFGMVDEVEEVEEEGETKSPPPKKKAKRTTKKKTTAKASSKKGPKRASGEGAPSALTKLVEDGYFSKPKTIGNIVEHCEHNLARKFKSNDFSGKLARLVRDGTLKRTKNSDNQYEYINA